MENANNNEEDVEYFPRSLYLDKEMPNHLDQRRTEWLFIADATKEYLKYRSLDSCERYNTAASFPSLTEVYSSVSSAFERYKENRSYVESKVKRQFKKLVARLDSLVDKPEPTVIPKTAQRFTHKPMTQEEKAVRLSDTRALRDELEEDVDLFVHLMSEPETFLTLTSPRYIRKKLDETYELYQRVCAWIMTPRRIDIGK